MLHYLFILLSVLGTAALSVHLHWHESLHILWQAPLTALGLFLVGMALFALLILLSAAAVDLKKAQTKRNGYYAFLLRAYAPAVFFLMRIHVHVTGREKLPQEGNFLLVCNHLNIFDPVALFLAIPARAKLSFITKVENFDLPIVKQFMHRLLCLPLDRNNDRQALRTIIKAAKLLEEDALSMTIFPEGQTSKSGELLPFRNGAFKIAQKANRPIVVATLQNTKSAPKNMFRRPTHIPVHILGVIPADEVVSHTTTEIGDRVHAMMEADLYPDKHR